MLPDDLKEDCMLFSGYRERQIGQKATELADDITLDTREVDK